MHGTPSEWLIAGVVVTLAFFALVAYIVKVLQSTNVLPRVLIALGTLFGVLPAILYALYQAAWIGA
ncbi:hypothetical protein [Streptomyces sp. B6B3]|uniref:hypothetical protein n=1 Tax=Streptomyces sp. B6B3 TaxID=3153570 RepID=UPI00325D10E1